MNRVLMFWIAMLLVVGGGLLIFTMTKRAPLADQAGSVQVADTQSPQSDREPMDEFELLDQTGRRVNSHEFDGQVWAGSFFFSACPGTCYNQNIKLQQLHAKYADRGLKLVSITCDPGKDTPSALSGYASRFNADADLWKFLTPADGDMHYISNIANDFFQVAVGPETHTDRVVLFDRQGKMLGAFSVLRPEQFSELDKLIDQALSATEVSEADSAPSTNEGSGEANS